MLSVGEPTFKKNYCTRNYYCRAPYYTKFLWLSLLPIPLPMNRLLYCPLEKPFGVFRPVFSTSVAEIRINFISENEWYHYHINMTKSFLNKMQNIFISTRTIVMKSIRGRTYL